MTAKMLGINIPSKVSEIPRDYDGFVFISDIDKTYLITQIDSLGGLIKAALEAPEGKENVPGFAILLRALRRGAAPEARANPLFFVSASPPQMRQKLLAKMEYDGLEHEGIILKDQFKHVRKADFKKLYEQIGYKVSALLSVWNELPAKSKLIFFGDDSESDAIIFSLFSEILAKSVKPAKLVELLKFLGVSRVDAIKIGWVARGVKTPVFPVRAAFINLVTGTSPDYYTKISPFFMASENTLQSALCFWEKGLIRTRALRSIARDLVINYDFEPEKLLESLMRGSERGLYSREGFRMVWAYLAQEELLPDSPDDAEPCQGEVCPNVRLWEETSLGRSSFAELKFRYTDESDY
ncbi:hypothetical protein GW915_10180 [bacterium]|nr:hypothetical protein [bacterium]